MQDVSDQVVLITGGAGGFYLSFNLSFFFQHKYFVRSIDFYRFFYRIFSFIFEGVGAHLARNFGQLRAKVVIWDVSSEGEFIWNSIEICVQHLVFTSQKWQHVSFKSYRHVSSFTFYRMAINILDCSLCFSVSFHVIQSNYEYARANTIWYQINFQFERIAEIFPSAWAVASVES